MSRNLKPIRNEYVQQLFGKHEYNGYDGELIVGDPTSQTCFRDTSSGVTSRDGKGYDGFGWWYYNSWSGWGYGRSNTMSQNIVQNIPGGSDQVSETIALGKISIKANVSVTFELKK